MPKKNIKVVSLFAIIIFFTMIVLFGGLFCGKTYAEEQQPYFYQQLGYKSKQFYDKLAKMNSEGVFKSGKDYDVSDIINVDDVALHENGNTYLLTSFTMAVDAFNLDNPDIFYVDFSALTLRIGKKTVGNEKVYSASITKNGKSYFVDDNLTVNDINSQIIQYNKKVNELISQVSLISSVEAKIKYVNDYLIKNNTYSFEENFNGEKTISTSYAPYIKTSYGALVNNKSIGDGYSKAFKAIMDKIEIPCVIVQGFGAEEDEKGEVSFGRHVWNYVQIESHWYGVDVTWNDTRENIYTLLGENQMKLNHYPNGVQPLSNFCFSYPYLSGSEYGFTMHSGLYSYTYQKDSGENSKMIAIASYNGLNATALEEKGLFLIIKKGVYNNGSINWDSWTSISRAEKHFPQEFVNTNKTSSVYVDINYEVVQIALTRSKPNYNPNNYDKSIYYTEEAYINFIEKSQEYENLALTDFKFAPNIVSISPKETTFQAGEEYNIEIEYSEQLKKTSDGEIGIEIISQYNDISENAVIKDFVWNENQSQKVAFKFIASSKFNHRNIQYQFRLINLIGLESEKVPVLASIQTQNRPVFYGSLYQGRPMFYEVYGQPTLVGGENLNVEGWNAGGEFLTKNKKDQLMLISTFASEDIKEKIKEFIQEDILNLTAIQTNLVLGGKSVSVSEGKSLRIGFNFPNGYDSKNKNISYKLYLTKLNNVGEILSVQEVPCMACEFGIVAYVNNFGIFSVVAIDKPATDKTLFVDIAGKGEVEISNSSNSYSTPLVKVVENQEIIVKFVPTEISQVENAILNGKTLQVENNSVILNHSNLDFNNKLVVYFVNKDVKQKEIKNEIENLFPEFYVIDRIGEISATVITKAKKVDKGLTISLSSSLTIKNKSSGKDCSFRYEWFKDGVLIEGVDSSNLLITNFSEKDEGNYTVKIYCDCEMRTLAAESRILNLQLAGINYLQLILGIIVAVATVVMCIIYFMSNKKRKV